MLTPVVVELNRLSAHPQRSAGEDAPARSFGAREDQARVIALTPPHARTAWWEHPAALAPAA